ncbi:MAG: protein-tyrosine-phosphatase [Bacteroidetes bacterium]|nr:protein-tyrosine-phosphatase [Bacteroidota bacterium]
MFPGIEQQLPILEQRLKDLPDERRTVLREIAVWIDERQRNGQTAALIFICTHNSRRSHISRLWAQALAWKTGLDHVRTYSGGTEATAFHPNAVRALRSCGFDITVAREGENPLYGIRYAPSAPPAEEFSKTYDDASTPSSDFAAVMTCNDADEACPIVHGATARFSLPYLDPKQADGTAEEESVYTDRCLQIAAEMLFIMREAGTDR